MQVVQYMEEQEGGRNVGEGEGGGAIMTQTKPLNAEK